MRKMGNYFKGFSIEHIDKSKNTEVEDSSVKTIELEPRMVNVIQGEDW
jgi:hypothetical protein